MTRVVAWEPALVCSLSIEVGIGSHIHFDNHQAIQSKVTTYKPVKVSTTRVKLSENGGSVCVSLS